MAQQSGNKRVQLNNRNLRRAQVKKNDEFYTCASDVHKIVELCKTYFAGKVIYCNCDNPQESNIAKYFMRNFAKLKLKGLYCTYYRQNSEIKAYKYYYNGVKMRRKEIAGNGSFDDEEFDRVYKKADLVVTNPPFSLTPKFIQHLIKKNVKFLIVANFNICGTEGLIECFERGDLQFCPLRDCRLRYFGVPISAKNNMNFTGQKQCRLGNCFWLTNDKTLFPRKKYVTLTKYNKAEHRPFDDWKHCININRLSQTPCDYEGLIAVPISYIVTPLAGFRFIGMCSTGHGFVEDRIKPFLYQDGKQCFTRCLILRTHTVGIGGDNYWRRIQSLYTN